MTIFKDSQWVTSWNSAAEQMYGYSAQEIIGRNISIITPAERLRELEAVHKKLKHGKQLEIFETVRRRKDGREIIVSITWSAICDANGTMTGVSSIARDVTEKKKTEEALRRSEKLLADFFENGALGLHWVGPDGTILRANRTELELLGYSAEEYIGHNIAEFHADTPVIEDILKKLSCGETLDCYEARLRCKDGSIKTVLINSNVLWEDGKFVHTRCFTRDITRQKQAEESLRKSNERFTSMVQSITDGFLVLDKNWRFVYLNPRQEEIVRPLDKSKDSLLGRVFWEEFPDVRGTVVEESFRRAMEDRITVEFEVFYPPLESWFHVRVYPWAEGGISVFTENINARKKAEEALRESEDLLRASFNQAAVGMAIAELDGRFHQVNQKFTEILGYTAEELSRLTFRDLTFADDLEETKKAMSQLLAGEIGYYALEKRYVRKDGSPVWTLATVTPLKDANGKPFRFVGVVEDISARKKAEEELRHNEREIRALADSMPQLAWMAEPDGHIFWYNRGWFDYTGTTLEQMQGWGWQSVHDPQMLPLVLERWRKSIATGEPFDMEFPLRGADGVYRWFLTRVNPVRDSRGRIVRWFGTNTNVDEVRRAQEALREETRVLELLNKTGASIASELNLEALVQAVTDAGRELSGAKFGAFFYNVINDQGEAILLYTLSGAPREAFEKFGMPRNTPIFNPTFSGQGVVRSNDITQDPHYGMMAPHHGMPKGHLPVRSYLAVPVISRSGEVIGGLFFGHPEPGIFTERSERLIVGIAAQAAIAIDNARLYENAQRQIAERKRTEEFNRSIIDSSRDCIKILDLQGNLTAMAESGQRMLCIPDIKPFLNKPWIDFWHGGDREAAQAAVNKAADGGIGNFVGFFKTFAGEPKWWDVLITPMLDMNGKPEKLLAVSRDVTESRQAAEMRFRLAAVVESSDDAIISKTLDGIITTWNKGAERMYGYTAQEVIGKPVTMLMPQDRVDEEPAILEKLKRGERIEHYETVRQRKDGTLLDVALTVSPIKDSSGAIIGASKIARDITQQKRAARELLRAKDELEMRVQERTASLLETTQQLETFCYTIAHDLRSPLRAQQSFAQMVLDDNKHLLNADAINFLQRIINSAQRLDKLVNDLLAYSRLSRDELKFQKVELAKVVQDVQSSLAEEIAARKATVSVDALPAVCAYEPTLNLIITNLVSNALKFVRADVTPCVKISAEKKGDRIRLWIEDNGIGISPEHTEKIFGVFQRLHPSDKYPGTGIGLAIVHKGLERMNGRVGVESEIGQGSRFWIELPAAC